MGAEDAFPADKRPFFGVRYKYKTTITQAGLFFTTDTLTALSDKSYSSFSVVGDNTWRTAMVDMRKFDHKNWTGTITSFRFDPTNPSDTDSVYQVSRLGFFPSEAEAQRFLAAAVDAPDYSEPTQFVAPLERVLVPGGRACINVANLGRKPYIPLHAYICEDMIGLNFLMRGEIIWNKGASGSPSTAWGSWRSAKNPTLRDVHEYILVFSKGRYGRGRSGGTSTIGRDEFLEWTKSVWSFGAEPARKIGHPAPFPVELPFRLIQLYTFAGDVVLDPFMGSGQTAIAALRAGRRYVGYDTDESYVRLAERRIAAAAAARGGDDGGAAAVSGTR